ncbi:MAG: tetratricopeptide repeat protein [bacterium]|nr:tetratricopeptide repeat protein [bacterium]
MLCVFFLFVSTPELSSTGDYFFNLSKYEKALEIYTLDSKENPSSVLDKKLLLCKNRLIMKQDHEKYISAFNALKKGDTLLAKNLFSQINDLYSLGIINYNQNLIDDAYNCFYQTNNLYGKGLCKYKTGDYNSAITYLSQAENSPDADLFIAEAYYKLNEFKNAGEYYSKALKNPTLKHDALYGLAWSHYKLSNFSESANEFSRFSTDYPNDKLCAKALYYSAMSFYYNNNISKSLEYLSKVRDNYPDFELMESVYYWLGKLYYGQSNFEASLNELKLLISKFPNSKSIPESYLLCGDCYYNIPDYDSAICYYNKITGPEWHLDEAKFRIEKCYFKLGKYYSYIDVLSNFIRKYPDSPRSPSLAMEIARSWVKKERFSDAIAAYNKMIQQFSWSNIINDAKYELAQCYLQVGKSDEAINIYQELLKTSLCQKVQLKIANTYFEIENYTQALNEYNTVIDKYPKSPEAKEAKFKIGVAYELLQKPAETRKFFQKFINEYPEDTKLWDIKLRIAKTYWNEGFIDQYRKSLLDIDAHGSVGTSREAGFLLGNLYFNESDYKNAKIFYIKASDKYEDVDSKARALLGAAKCTELLTKTEDAIKLYESVILLSPNPLLEREANEKLKNLRREDTKNEQHTTYPN